jgi:hypothetical protein
MIAFAGQKLLCVMFWVLLDEPVRPIRYFVYTQSIIDYKYLCHLKVTWMVNYGDLLGTLLNIIPVVVFLGHLLIPAARWHDTHNPHPGSRRVYVRMMRAMKTPTYHSPRLP